MSSKSSSEISLIYTFCRNNILLCINLHNSCIMKIFYSSIRGMVRGWKVLGYLGCEDEIKAHLSQREELMQNAALASHGGSEPPLTTQKLFSLQFVQPPNAKEREPNPQLEASCQGSHAVTSGDREMPRPTYVQCIMSLRHITRHGCHNVRITPANVTGSTAPVTVTALANLSSVHFASKMLQLRGSWESLGISQSQGQETRRKTSSQGLPW